MSIRTDPTLEPWRRVLVVQYTGDHREGCNGRSGVER